MSRRHLSPQDPVSPRLRCASNHSKKPAMTVATRRLRKTRLDSRSPASTPEDAPRLPLTRRGRHASGCPVATSTLNLYQPFPREPGPDFVNQELGVLVWRTRSDRPPRERPQVTRKGQGEPPVERLGRICLDRIRLHGMKIRHVMKTRPRTWSEVI